MSVPLIFHVTLQASQHEISLEYKGIGAESDQHLCRDICVKGDLNRLDQVSRSILMYLFKIAPKRSVLEVSEELVSADQRLSPHTRRKRRSSSSLRLTGARSTHVAPIAFDVALQPRQFIRVMFSVSNFVLPEVCNGRWSDVTLNCTLNIGL